MLAPAAPRINSPNKPIAVITPTPGTTAAISREAPDIPAVAPTTAPIALPMPGCSVASVGIDCSSASDFSGVNSAIWWSPKPTERISAITCSASDLERNTPLTASMACHPFFYWLHRAFPFFHNTTSHKPQSAQPTTSDVAWSTACFHLASKLIEASDDSKTKIRPVPLVLSQKESQDRPPPQPGHLRYEKSSRSSRAGSAIFQTSLGAKLLGLSNEHGVFERRKCDDCREKQMGCKGED